MGFFLVDVEWTDQSINQWMACRVWGSCSNPAAGMMSVCPHGTLSSRLSVSGSGMPAASFKGDYGRLCRYVEICTLGVLNKVRYP